VAHPPALGGGPSPRPGGAAGPPGRGPGPAGDRAPGQVWTADPAEVPALGELPGADALLLDCLDDHQDPAARVQRATLLAVWFKANTTSPLFVNEGVVMGALAGLFPGQVPAPLAVEPERGLDGAGRPGVTNGTGGRCRTAQSGRRPPPQTAGRCTAERWGEMELDATATALPELIACPEPGCDVPAGVVDRFVLASTGGPVEHARTWCLEGHGFTQRVDALVAWPMVRARRPLETG
jgi:hypothetical protein